MTYGKTSGGWPYGCECFDCTKCSGAPTEWVADLGVGGWTQNACYVSPCEAFAGEINLNRIDISGDGGSTCSHNNFSLCLGLDDVCCLWQGAVHGRCTSDPFTLPCVYCPNLSGGKSQPALALHSLGATWKYTLWVYLTCNYIGYSRVIYSSSESSSIDCMDLIGEDGKITLTKDSEAHVPTAKPCVGTMPTTVDIWAA
jgi:hypothetical protein